MLPRISHVCGEDAEYLLFSGRDFISNNLFVHGSWDKHLLEISRIFISGLAKPLVFDIGANLGAYAIPLAKSIQDVDGEVVAFEAQRIIYYQLCGNIFLNRLENCHAIHSVVGVDTGFTEVPEVRYDDNTNIGAFSLVREYRIVNGVEKYINNRRYRVPSISLGKVCKTP